MGVTQHPSTIQEEYNGSSRTEDAMTATTIKCEACEGRGHFGSDLGVHGKCPECGGRGRSIVHTETKTVAKLYETNSDIRDLINVWVERRRCPMGLVDELISEGMEDAADCALWAATDEERPLELLTDEKLSPPYPGQREGNHWWWHRDTDEAQRSRDVPHGRIPDHCRKRQFKGLQQVREADADSELEAIIWLLDNWRRA